MDDDRVVLQHSAAREATRDAQNRRVGTHRRILAQDVLRLTEEERNRRQRVMGKLVDETERQGL